MREVSLPFGSLLYFEQYVISTIDSGVDFDKDCVDTLIRDLNEHYGDHPFVYITNRKNDYSLNPTEARRIISETSLSAAAFVLVRKFSFDSFKSERAFYKIPTEAFPSLRPAIEWAESQVKNVVFSKS